MPIIKERKFRVSSIIENLSPSGLIDGDPEKTESTPDGFLKISDGEILLSYAENTDGGKVICDILIKDEEISVKRRGAVVSDMLFREGYTDKSIYQVLPYSFDVEVYTKKIRSTMTKDGGRVDIFYRMTIGGADKNVKLRIDA